MGREVSESCVDSLLTEMVSTYCNRFYANKPELAARRIEAIGYQVGHQLSERYNFLNLILAPNFIFPFHYNLFCKFCFSIYGFWSWGLLDPKCWIDAWCYIVMFNRWGNFLLIFRIYFNLLTGHLAVDKMKGVDRYQFWFVFIGLACVSGGTSFYPTTQVRIPPIYYFIYKKRKMRL